MQFFFPDSLDLVDPAFDFESEEWSPDRVRQRDDHYAHEVFETPPFDGLLVSKGIVDGFDSASRYTVAQRQRLSRVGIREFFRLDNDRTAHLLTMGDCGAFSYAKQEKPPYSVEQVADFYEELGFDIGVSPDHIVFGFDPSYDDLLPGVEAVPEEYRTRQRITLDLAAEFLEECDARERPFEPIAVAHGWSPASYAAAVEKLQRIGYRRVALGGLVPLKTHEIRQIVEAAGEARADGTSFHLLGVTRIGHIDEFRDRGVTSFDSTSPLRQAFKDDRDNYYTPDRTYPAIRVPQVEKNAKLKKLISKGAVDSGQARIMERNTLKALRAFDAGDCSMEDALHAVCDYNEFCGLGTSYFESYREVLTDSPWKRCDCAVCRDVGINVILFRGAERNRRRGFHNLYVFRERFAETAGSLV
jgi:hypothetical protein